MTAHPELMRQIANAMERNPEGWWREFEEIHMDAQYRTCESKSDAIESAIMGCLRPKPRTYRLVIEDMPEPLREEPKEGERYWYANPKSGKVGRLAWANDKVDRACFNNGFCYPDEPTAREALEKLTRAMGGEE